MYIYMFRLAKKLNTPNTKFPYWPVEIMKKMLQPELIMDSIFDRVEHPDFNMDCLVDFYDSDQIPTFFVATDD